MLAEVGRVAHKACVFDQIAVDEHCVRVIPMANRSSSPRTRSAPNRVHARALHRALLPCRIMRSASVKPPGTAAHSMGCYAARTVATSSGP